MKDTLCNFLIMAAMVVIAVCVLYKPMKLGFQVSQCIGLAKDKCSTCLTNNQCGWCPTSGECVKLELDVYTTTLSSRGKCPDDKFEMCYTTSNAGSAQGSNVGMPAISSKYIGQKYNTSCSSITNSDVCSKKADCDWCAKDKTCVDVILNINDYNYNSQGACSDDKTLSSYAFTSSISPGFGGGGGNVGGNVGGFPQPISESTILGQPSRQPSAPEPGSTSTTSQNPAPVSSVTSGSSYANLVQSVLQKSGMVQQTLQELQKRNAQNNYA